MNTLKDHVILYDSECPMCKVYTHAFTSTGMLDNQGRTPYQQIPETLCPLIDRQRAVNEIALVDKTTGEVNYGIESLFKVIGHSFPIFRPLFSWHPFTCIMKKVYAFISYNRKVIIPAPKTSATTIQPSFRLDYRIAYLFFTIAVAGSILTAYAKILAETNFITPGTPYREYLICTGQVVFQGLIVSSYAPKKRWDYLGNMMTISLAGALLLIPAIIIAKHIHLPATLTLGYFGFVVSAMLLEHIRRTKLLSLGWLPTLTWTAYRAILLIFLIHT